jgi:pyrimidine deaminase RibD-like protein
MYSERQELHDTLLRLALGESKKCVPSPTAFSVGAVIFLPRSTVTSKTDTNHLDELHTLLEPFFPTLIGAAAGTDEDEGQEDPGVEVQGLILSSSYSRALEGNTHAEANALTLLERKIPGLPLQVQQSVLALTGTQSSEQEALPGAVYNDGALFEAYERTEKLYRGNPGIVFETSVHCEHIKPLWHEENLSCGDLTGSIGIFSGRTRTTRLCTV